MRRFASRSIYVSPTSFKLIFPFEYQAVFASRVLSLLFFPLDLQPVPISDHQFTTADELSHQCAVRLRTPNSHERKARATTGAEHLSPPAAMDDYQRRFQRSLQKLTVPRWYTDAAPSNSGSKQSINSTTSSPWKAHYRETQRTPEIVHMRHPNGYRSCRSSLATSPSPSVHSWHPHPTFDGMSLSLLRPAAPRRQKQYEKGIDRVSKSSRWYRPTPLVDKQTTSSPAGKTDERVEHGKDSALVRCARLLAQGQVG